MESFGRGFAKKLYNSQSVPSTLSKKIIDLSTVKISIA